jgi:RND family efflux transporter MFP subunit
MRNKWLWVAIAVVFVAAAALWWQFEGPVAVTLVELNRGPAVDAIYATGTVEPTVMLPIAPRVAGRLVELNVDEGAKVRKGQALARLDDADLASTVDELAAREQFARAQYERTQSLVARGFVSKVELDRTRADLDAAVASLKRARAQREFMALTAPADGDILRRDGEIGQFIPVGQAVFYLSCCAPLRVTADIDEEDISRVHVGQKVLLKADAVPGRVLDGEVSEVTPKGDPVARSYRVRIKLGEPGVLRVGMTVDANLIVAERPNALLVFATTIKDGAVWIVLDGKLHRQPVKVGVTGAARAEITEGLAPSAQVVDKPTDELREGRSVRVHKAK